MNLSKSEFGMKYLMPVIAAFITFGALGSIYMTTLRQENLETETGQVLNIGLNSYQRIRSNHNNYFLSIRLDNYSHEFRLLDFYENRFNSI